jgi:uncharacterized membrane protein YoaK (UPF0700 family)
MSEILSDAWRTLVPDSDERHGPLQPLMVLLTFVTGFVDAYSFLELGRVFVANMTGNVVFLGFAAAGSSQFSFGNSILALATFVAGAFVGGRLARSQPAHRGRLLYNALLIEFVLVATAYFIAQFGPNPGSGVKYPLIILLAAGMGVQNATARRLAVPDLTTTVLTLTITGTAADSRFVGGAGAKLGRRTVAVLAMFAGAVFGALFIVNGHAPIALLCAVVLLAGATYAAERTLASSAAWTRP